MVKGFFMITNYIKMRFIDFFSSQRPMVVASYVFLSLFGVFDGIKAACRLLGYNISIYTYPHLLGTPFMRTLVLAGIVLVFLNAPFPDNISEILIIKMGKKLWYLANFFYIVLKSCLYTSVYNIGILIGLRGYQSLVADWGKIITSLARSFDLMAEFAIKISYSQNIIDKYQPIEAMVHANLISILEFTIVGMIIFSVSLYFKSNWPGIISACLYIMLGQIDSLALPGFLTALIPTNFLDIGVFESGSFLWSFNLGEGYVILIGIIIVLLLAGYFRLKRMDIIVYKEFEL